MRKVPWTSLSFVAGMGIAVAIARAQNYPQGFWGFILTDPYLLPLLAILAACLLLYGLSGVEVVRKPLWRGFAFLVPPPEHAAKGRLKIHSALLGNGPNNDRDVRDRLQQLCANSSLDIVISYQLLIGPDPAKDDPAPGEDKRLLVEYSFAGGPVLIAERPQSTRLILPEDPWMRRRVNDLESSCTELREYKAKLTSESADLMATMKGEQQENQRLREVIQTGVDYSNGQASQITELSGQVGSATVKISSLQARLTGAIADRNVEFEASGILKSKVASLENELVELRQFKEIPQLLVAYKPRDSVSPERLVFINEGHVTIGAITIGPLLWSNAFRREINLHFVLGPIQVKQSAECKFAVFELVNGNQIISELPAMLREITNKACEASPEVTVEYQNTQRQNFRRRFILSMDPWNHIAWTPDPVMRVDDASVLP